MECTAGARNRNNSKNRELDYKKSKSERKAREGDAMTRSVEELRRESERSRAQLAATVNRLKEQVSETAEDIRLKVSPQHIKSEVSDYVSHTTKSWVDGLKQQIMDNPMRSVAAGTALAVPLLRMAPRGPPPPLLLGAGPARPP